jgi:hypothetical protein
VIRFLRSPIVVPMWICVLIFVGAVADTIAHFSWWIVVGAAVTSVGLWFGTDR